MTAPLILRGLRPAGRRDLTAAVEQHAGVLFCGSAGASHGLRVRWNVALAIEEAGLATCVVCDPAKRLWRWEVTDAAADAVREWRQHLTEQPQLGAA